MYDILNISHKNFSADFSEVLTTQGTHVLKVRTFTTIDHIMSQTQNTSTYYYKNSLVAAISPNFYTNRCQCVALASVQN